MVFDIITLFPDYFTGPLDVSILRRAREAGRLTVNLVDLRPYGEGPHQQVDDYPYGGGAGMILKADPVCRAVEDTVDARRREGLTPRVVLLSPQGETFDQKVANRLAEEASVVLVCGHYKALDERVRESVVDEEISLGDFVLTGGEAPAAVIVEAVARLLPGVLGDEESYRNDSFYQGRLDGPYYTRPRVFRGLEVPDVLLSGDHEKIRRWRVRESLRRTLERRPDLLDGRELAPEEREILKELRGGVENHGTG